MAPQLIHPSPLPSVSCARNVRSSWPAGLVTLVLLFATLLVTGCGMGTTSTSVRGNLQIQGSMHGGQQPVTGALLQIYAVGTTGDGSAATPLITTTLTTSDGSGNASNSNANIGNASNSLPAGAFTLTGQYTCPSADTQVYLVATGGNPGLAPGVTNPALAMMTVLGRCGDLSASTHIELNELTTVASIVPIAQYMTGYANLGSGPADATQFVAALDLVRQYANNATGTLPGPQLPPGYYASQLEVQTLGDILAGCVNSSGGTPCTELFTLTTPPVSQAVRPTNTIEATINLVRYPNNNVQQIFSLLLPNAPFQPTLLSAPASWSTPILPIAATPMISPAGGTMTVAPSISITSATQGAIIRYTTDGSTPTAASPVYNAPFRPTGTVTVKAIAFATNFAASAVASTTYTLPNAGVATALSFSFPPITTVQSAGLNDISVQVVDAYGTAISQSGVAITLRLGANPVAATLTGTLTAVTQRGGAASFSGLKISALGTGYTMIASSAAYGSVESASFDQIGPYITLTPSSPAVGLGSTLSGKIKLATAAPAGGVTVTLSSSDDTKVGIAPATVNLAAGLATADFTYTGVAEGTSTLRAAASGYTDGTSDVTATTASVVMQQPTGLLPGATVQLPITLSQPAPAGGITVTIVSSATSVATIGGATVTFPAGSNKPVAYPTITGVAYGSTTLTATANTAFAPGTLAINITSTLTLTSTLNISQYGTGTDTLTLGSPAPVGGLVFVLTADATTLVSIPTTVTIPGGSTSATFSVISKGTVGSTTIRANRTGLPEATTTVKVAGFLSMTTVTTGVKLQTQATAGLGGTTAAPTVVTITSGAPGVALVSADPNLVGATSISVTVPAGSSTAYYYVQGVSVGTASITATSDAATSGSSATMTVRASTVTVSPTQTGYFTSNFSTTTNSADSTFGVHLGLVNGSAVDSCGGFAPGNSAACTTSPLATITVPLSNTSDAVGTLSASSVTFANNSQTASATFHPVGAGTTTVAVGTPVGFAAPTSYASMAVTVTAPTFTFVGGTVYTGNGVYLPFAASLSATPKAPVTVTVTSSNPNVLLVSGNAGVMGSASVDFPNVTGAVPTTYLQGVGTGTVTITYSSPGYTSLSNTVVVTPAGLVFNGSSGTSTTTASPNGFVGVILAVFTDANANSVKLYCNTSNQFVCGLNPNVSPQFALGNSNSTAASTSPNPFTLPTTSITTVAFQPLAAGSGTLTFATQPFPLLSATYGTYGNQNFQVTQASLSASAATTGAGMYVTGTAALSVAPASTNPKTLTITSGNPAVALLSTTPGGVGQASITFTNITNTAAYTYYVQGQSVGTSSLSVSAPGFTNGTSTLTVLPVGAVFSSATAATFSGSAFDSPRTLTVNLALLNASTGAIQTVCTNTCYVNPGVSFSIPVTSSNTNVGTISASPLTIATGANSATTTFVPSDVGTTAIAIAQTAGLTQTTSAGYTSGTATITGTYFNPSATVISEGTYTSKTFFLPTTPPAYPVTVTVSLADPLAKLSTSESTMGTGSSLTFTVTSGLQLPTIYVQGTTAGRTMLLMQARGFATGRAPVTVYKTGVSFVLPNEAGLDINLSTTSPSPTAGAIITYLDPTTLSFISYCGLGTCKANPGQSTATVFATDDGSVATATSAAVSADTNSMYQVPLNPVATGVTTLRIATPPSGWYICSTAYHANARIVINDVTHLVAHDVDTAVGLQVQTGFTLSATNLASLSATFTATIADPSIAVIGASYATAGGTSVSATGYGALGYTFVVQGLKAGTTTMTVSGGGYTPRTVTIRVNAGGFVFRGADVVRNLSNGNVNVTMTPAVLNSTGQWIADAYATNPGTGAGSPTVPATSSDPGVGTVVTSPVLVGQTSAGGNVNFHPVAVGTTVLSVGTTTGFTQATTYNTLNATVQ